MEAGYVIVGTGSAGCAMAYRLSEAGASVLVIEHGGTDAGPLEQTAVFRHLNVDLLRVNADRNRLVL